MTEEQLGACVVQYLTGLGWDVYQEVQVHGGGSIADIVAKLGPVVWIVECKVSFGMKVLSQAYDWKIYANRVSVAVPARRFTRFEADALSHAGLGVITVPSRSYPHEAGAREEIAAPTIARTWNRQRMLAALIDQRKDFAKAGNSDGARWSPYQETCRQVVRHVRMYPGCTFKELLDDVTTHYASKSSARTSLAHWICAGKVRGVRLERDGRKLLLYPDAET